MGYWGQDVNANLLNASIFLAVFITGTITNIVRKKQMKIPLILLAAAGSLFLALLIQAISNILSDQLLFRFNWSFEVITIVLLIIWTEQLTFEHPRATIMLSFSFLGGLSIAYSMIFEPRVTLPDATQQLGTVIMMVDGKLGWSGAWQFTGIIFLLGFYVFFLVFLIRVISKTRLIIKIFLFAIFFVAIANSFLFTTMGEMIPLTAWYIILPFIIVISVVLIVYVVVLHPELLSILTYSLDRLVVIDADKGVSLFSYTWEKSHLENSDLIVPLLQALQSMSFEVLSMGAVSEIHMENGNLLFRKGEHVIAGIISSRSTRFLHARLAAFTDLFEIQFRDSLNNPMYDLTSFQPAKLLVEKIFKVLPLTTFKFSFKHKPVERDYLNEDTDSQLIQDLKDAFAADAEEE